MRRSEMLFGTLVLSALTFVLCFHTLAAPAGQPSAKATAKVGNIAIVEGPIAAGATEGDWQTVLDNTIKSSSKKDLLMTVAMECGMHTRTLVRSKGGNKDTSRAEASVEVRVLVDGNVAYPGVVVFSRRLQELSATFQGLLDGALKIDPDTGAIIIDEALLMPEEVELLLETMAANSFTFVLDDIGTGAHLVEVQARINLGTDAQTGSAVARATIGKGSLTVEEVRMIKGEDILLD